MPTGLHDVLTSDARIGDIDIIEAALDGETSGGMGTDPDYGEDGTVPTADDSAGTGVYDPTTTGDNTLGEVLGDILDAARNLGPDWLDEATIVVVVLAVLAAGLWLARPLLSIGAGVIGE